MNKLLKPVRFSSLEFAVLRTWLIYKTNWLCTTIWAHQFLEPWPDKWILHHDNAPGHDALTVREVAIEAAQNEDDQNIVFDRIPITTVATEINKDSYEGSNFNSGNYLFTTDTK